MKNTSRLQTIKDFLEQYRYLDIYLKEILKDVFKYYEKELMKEYSRIGNHPYPDEYLNYRNHINNNKVYRRID